MSATYAKPSYEIAIANKVYPDPDERSLTPAFETMNRKIIAAHQIDSRDMYPEFGRRVQEFKDTFVRTKDFLGSIVRSNMHGNDRPTIAAKMTNVRDRLQKITFSPPPGLTAEVAILDPKTRLTKLNESVALNVSALVYFVTTSLDSLVREQQVGLIEWFSDDVCRFHFYLNSLHTRDTILDRAHRVEGRTHTESWVRQTTRTEDRQRHQHDLVEAKCVDLSRYVPYRIERLAEMIPPLFRPFFRIVTGQQICEHVIRETTTTVESQGESRTWTEPMPAPQQSVWRHDPALVIGHYVIAGWDESEESESRKVDTAVDLFCKYRSNLGPSQQKMVRHIAHLYGPDRMAELSGLSGVSFRNRYLELAY